MSSVASDLQKGVSYIRQIQAVKSFVGIGSLLDADSVDLELQLGWKNKARTTATNSNSEYALHVLAQDELELGNYQEVIKVISQINYTEFRENAFLKYLKLFIRKDQRQAAQTLLEQVEVRSPCLIKALLILAKDQRQAGEDSTNYLAKAEELAAGQENEYRKSVAWANIARWYGEQGEFPDAVRATNRVTYLHPKLLLLRFYAAREETRSLVSTNELEALVPTVVNSGRNTEQASRFIVEIARVYLALGETQAAESVIADNQIDQKAQNTWFYQYATYLERNGKFSSARDAVNNISEPETRVRKFLAIAKTERKQGIDSRESLRFARSSFRSVKKNVWNNDIHLKFYREKRAKQSKPNVDLIKALPESYLKREAVWPDIKRLVKKGQIEEAQKLADLCPDHDYPANPREQCYAMIVEVGVKVGRDQEVTSIAKLIRNRKERDCAFSALAISCIKAGNWRQAEEFANELSKSSQKAPFIKRRIIELKREKSQFTIDPEQIEGLIGENSATIDHALGYEQIVPADRIPKGPAAVSILLGHSERLTSDSDPEDRTLLKRAQSLVRNSGHQYAYACRWQLGLRHAELPRPLIHKRTAELMRDTENLRVQSRLLLCMIEHKIHQSLSAPILRNPDLSDTVFLYLLREMSKQGIVTENVKYFLSKDNIPFLRQILARHQGQFNAALDILYNFRHTDLSEHGPNVLECLDIVGFISRGVWKEFLAAETKAEKQGIVKKYRELTERLIGNNSIARTGLNKTLVAEAVSFVYRPSNFSVKRIEKYLRDSNDYTEQLAQYRFPSDGYAFEVAPVGKYELRPGVSPNLDALNDLAAVSRAETATSVKDLQFTGRTLCNLGRLKTQAAPEEVQAVFGLFADHELFREFVSSYSQVNEDNAFQFLVDAEDMFDVFLGDNLADAISNFIAVNSGTTGRMFDSLRQTLLKPASRDKVERQLGIVYSDQASDAEIGEIVSHCFLRRVPTIRNYLRALKLEQSKFVHMDDPNQEPISNLRAFFSKNQAALFARSDLCIAGDTTYYTRPDYALLNVFERKRAFRAHVQCHLPIKKGKPILMMRGFNRKRSFANRVSPESFCEAALDVGREFVKDNNMEGLYLCGPIPGWHPLSNNRRMARYLEQKYCKKHEAFRFEIAEDIFTKSIFRVD